MRVDVVRWIPVSRACARGLGQRTALALADFAAARLERLASGHPLTSAGLRLAIVFVQWDFDRAVAARSRLATAVAALDGLVVDWCLVDNRGVAGALPTSDSDMPVVGGTNEAAEFSGYEAGRRFILEHRAAPDVWLFVNDRFDAYHDPLPNLTAGALALIQAAKAIAGHIDGYPTHVTSFGYDFSAWIATSFFIIEAGALEKLGGLVQVDGQALDAILLPNYVVGASPFTEGGPIEPAFASYLLEWLTGDPASRLVETWYRKVRLGPDTWPTFRAKVQSILNEHLLTSRAREAGIPVVPLDVARRIAEMPQDHPAVRRALAELTDSVAELPARLSRPWPRIRLALGVLGSPTSIPDGGTAG